MWISVERFPNFKGGRMAQVIARNGMPGSKQSESPADKELFVV
jgi:hypothetical protein